MEQIRSQVSEHNHWQNRKIVFNIVPSWVRYTGPELGRCNSKSARASPRRFDRGDGCRHHPSYPKIFSFSPDSGHFVLKMLKMYGKFKILHVTRKKTPKFSNFWGTSLDDFWTGRHVLPPTHTHFLRPYISATTYLRSSSSSSTPTGPGLHPL